MNLHEFNINKSKNLLFTLKKDLKTFSSDASVKNSKRNGGLSLRSKPGDGAAGTAASGAFSASTELLAVFFFSTRFLAVDQLIYEISQPFSKSFVIS